MAGGGPEQNPGDVHVKFDATVRPSSGMCDLMPEEEAERERWLAWQVARNCVRPPAAPERATRLASRMPLPTPVEA